MTKTAILRADGGEKRGGGHLARIRVIAQALTGRGFQARLFAKDEPAARDLLRDFPGRVDYLRAQDNELKILETQIVKSSAALVVLDVLDTSPEFVHALKKTGARVVTIDDTGRGADVADASFCAGCPSPGMDAAVRAAHLGAKSPPHPGKSRHNGPAYALLSPAIAALRDKTRVRPAVERVIAFFGTFDPERRLDWVAALAADHPSIVFHAVTCRTDLEKTENFKIHPLMFGKFADFLAQADVALIAGGVSLFEAAALGIPTIVLPQVEHEFHHARMFESASACLALAAPSPESLAAAFQALVADATRRRQMSESAKLFVDGKGLERFLEIVLR